MGINQPQGDEEFNIKAVVVAGSKKKRESPLLYRLVSKMMRCLANLLSLKISYNHVTYNEEDLYQSQEA